MWCKAQHNRVPDEIKIWEVELDPHFSPEEVIDHEQGGGAGLRQLDFFRFGLFINSSAMDTVLVTLPSTAVETARCTMPMARGHRLNTAIVLAEVHGLSSLFQAVSAVMPSLSCPPLPPHPHIPIPYCYKQPCFCGRKAKWSRSVKYHGISYYL